MAIGVLFALFAGVFRYVDQHFHTPETFLENTSELAVNADIRERLFEGFRADIILMADDEAEEEGAGGLGSILDADDPLLGGADPVTEERIARDQAIEEILLDVFDSQLYSDSFAAGLSSTQQQLIVSADLESAALLRNKGEVFFDMRPLNATVYDRLAADERTAEITQNPVPAGFGVFKVADRETTANFLWTLLRNGPSWRSLTTAGALLSLIGAVVIAERRPSTAIQFGGGMVGVGIVLIVVLYLIRFVVPLLAGGGSSASPVVATYASNIWPLVTTMIRLVVMGSILAAVGGIAKLIWPDDWVYSSVSDDRGVRSVMRRRGAPEAQPQPQQEVQLPAAAMVPGYPGYPQQPYPGYPQQWAQPYPGQFPPGYPTAYPTGPYAQPGQPLPQHYTSPGKPTVPVMPVEVGSAGELVPPAPPPLDAVTDDLPADAAQAVPRVVATTDAPLDTSAAAGVNKPKSAVFETMVASNDDGDTVDDDEPVSSQEPIDEAEDSPDDASEWAAEKDW